MACWYPKREEKNILDLLLNDNRYRKVLLKIKEMKNPRDSYLRFISNNMDWIYSEMKKEFESHFRRLCLPFVKLILKIKTLMEKIIEKVNNRKKNS